MKELPTVCILAGGLGTRLGERVRHTPKPLLTVAGQPFIFHQLQSLASHGARRIVICVGYLGEQFVECVGLGRFGLHIEYSNDPPGVSGTLAAVREAAPLLGDRFLTLYGDTYLRLDYAAAVDAWLACDQRGLMTVLRNDGKWGRSNAVYAEGLVKVYDKVQSTAEMAWIDYGLGGLTASALALEPGSATDLASLFSRLARMGELCGYEATERFYEIGSPEALNETDRFLRSVRRP